MITNKDLQYSIWNSAQCYVAAWMGRDLGGRMYTCICMAEFLCCSPETITTLFVIKSLAYEKRMVMSSFCSGYRDYQWKYYAYIRHDSRWILSLGQYLLKDYEVHFFKYCCSFTHENTKVNKTLSLLWGTFLYFP